MKLASLLGPKKVITQGTITITQEPLITVMKKIIEKISPFKIHIYSWIIFISAEIIIIGLASGEYGKPGNYFSHYLLNIFLFYMCGEVIYPKVFKKGLNWIWRFPLGTTLIFLVYLWVSFLLDLQITLHTSWNNIDDIFMDRQFFFRVLWRALQFMGFAGLYYVFKEYQKEVKSKELANEKIYSQTLKNKNMEIQLNQAQNSYLKAQINPHLLFNTLNFLYQDLFQTAPKSAEIVMALADVMRYSVNSEFENTIPLAKEIEQAENLIKLHLSRFGGDRQLQFVFDEEVNSVKFIPLVIITLIENIFKHGKLTDPSSPAKVIITYRDDILKIKTENLIDKAQNIPSLNQGLENTRGRLNFAYGEHATLNYGVEGDQFKLMLSVSTP